jgi:hypothetical protein
MSILKIVCQNLIGYGYEFKLNFLFFCCMVFDLETIEVS